MSTNYSSLQPPDWDSEEKKMWKENHAEVAVEVEERAERLMKRVALFVWRFDYKEKDVVAKIRHDEMFAAWFAKEPRRQSPHERIAAEYLQKFPELIGFKRLPQSGKNALYVNSDGEIRMGEDIQGGKPSKALDFAWKTPNGISCYASHKYTREGGGNQDSQFNEQLNLLKHFFARSTNDSALFVICDGPYYNNQRMQTLSANCRTFSPLSFAVHIEEVPGLMAQLSGKTI